jgi:hypothetical protein
MCTGVHVHTLRCSSSLGQLDSRVGLCAWCVARSWVGCVVWTVVTALYIHVDRVALRDSKRRSNDIAHPATARKRRGQPPNINTEWGPPCACGNCGTGAGRRREPRVRARARRACRRAGCAACASASARAPLPFRRSRFGVLPFYHTALYTTRPRPTQQTSHGCALPDALRLQNRRAWHCVVLSALDPTAHTHTMR